MQTKNNLHTTLKKINEVIIDQKQELIQTIKVEKSIKYPNLIQSNSQELSNWREKLVNVYAEAILLKKQESIVLLNDWGRETADLLIAIQFPLDLAIEEIKFYRDVIGDIIKEQAKADSLSLDEFYELLSSFDHVVDHAIHLISVFYMKKYSTNIQSAKNAVDELSVPIVNVSEKIGVLPLIGDLDTQRAQILMDVALTKSAECAYEYLIIDLSGVPVIDTMVANQIFKVLDALQLLGVETKLSGIRPEIAQTMISLGLDFKETKSFSSLHLALEFIGFEQKNLG
ncbi:STAS domain-containing protein [Metabacillus idriensis]|uniref:STAS domain-containing protein n=1 Tax=Metabacillus idriensis TaxID=324768 RepID=UPI002812A7F8|nr:STAS domain-containing protein [Metabacillus idriensis]MDR0136538.1 STAS domain-containing protein [Metabacillus idriensis]